MLRFWLAFLVLGGTAFAQPDRGCEERREIGSAFEKLENDQRDLPYARRTAATRSLIEDLIAKYPRDPHVYKRHVRFGWWGSREDLPGIRERYRALAAQKPDDAVALYAAGVALAGHDTPEAVRLLELAAGKGVPEARIELAEIHASGRFVNKDRARKEIAAFFDACPGSLDSAAHRQLGDLGPAELQASVARSLRLRLEREREASVLRNYAVLWGLEFRTRPPGDHDALRKQVTADLTRLEALNPRPDARWLDFMKNGYKQSGAPPEAATAIEERILKEFPQSQQALNILHIRWRKDNPEPDANASAEAWDAYNLRYARAMEGLAAQFPNESSLKSSIYYALSQVRSVPPEELIRAAEAHLAATESYWGYGGSTAVAIAREYLKRGIAIERALALIDKGIPEAWKELERDNPSRDDWQDTQHQNMAKYRAARQLDYLGLRLQAYRAAGKLDAARALASQIDGPVPIEAAQESQYWWNRARLAEIENRRTDALAFYQKALGTRQRPPEKLRGRLEDRLLDEARALWRATGGSEQAFALWCAPSKAARREETEGRWQKPDKVLPAFELSDLNGQTWALKKLKGRTLLVNLWATWCSPCKSELPHFQKLYDKLRDRKDIAVFTLNLDDELGLVAPFMNENRYTFPALPAYSFVNDLFDGRWGIPQNWIIDARGKWQWQQMGFASGDPNWEESMMARLEAVKASK